MLHEYNTNIFPETFESTHTVVTILIINRYKTDVFSDFQYFTSEMQAFFHKLPRVLILLLILWSLIDQELKSSHFPIFYGNDTSIFPEPSVSTHTNLVINL